MILWTNGVLHALTNINQTYEKMLTHEGLIVGFDHDIKDMDYDQVIDLKGAHLYPGLVDSHLHLLGYGRKLSRPNLRDQKSIAEVLSVIAKHPEATVFEGFMLEGLTKQILDKHFKDRYIVLRHHDYHAATLNQKTLDILELQSDDGIIHEEDAQRAMHYFGVVDKDGLKIMFEKALNQLYAYGITGGHSDDLSYFSPGFQGTLEAMDDTLRHMPFRANLLVHHDVLDAFITAGLPPLDQHEYLQLGAIKIFYDGTFSSKTALVSTPYLGGSKGMHMFDSNELERLIQKVRHHHLPLAIHVIGDVGLAEVFDLLEKYPAPRKLHDRIIHASMWQEKDIERAKKLPLIFDIQPQFITSDVPFMKNIFKEVPQNLYPFKKLYDQGLIICCSSDAPVETPNPLLGMYDAVYREVGQEVHDKDQCLSRFEALKLYTAYANVPTYKENRGYLKKGFVADFTVFKHDVLTIPKDQFKHNFVTLTVVNEHIVYQG